MILFIHDLLRGFRALSSASFYGYIPYITKQTPFLCLGYLPTIRKRFANTQHKLVGILRFVDVDRDGDVILAGKGTKKGKEKNPVKESNAGKMRGGWVAAEKPL